MKAISKITSNTVKKLQCPRFAIDAKTSYAARGVYSAPIMKRRISSTIKQPKPKKPRAKEPDYHLTPSLRNEDGEVIWPAPKYEMERARQVICECAIKNKKTVIVPDKDADGLSSGVILKKTLSLLGLEDEKIAIHLLEKGETVHSESERQKIQSYEPSYVFVLDQGTAPGPPIIDSPHTSLIIDHHYYSDPIQDIPKDAIFVNACHSPPVATSSLLTYELCKPLHHAVASDCAWLCAIGTQGVSHINLLMFQSEPCDHIMDLGNTIKWEPPFPDMAATFKQHSKSSINTAISLLNAPRRTATFDVHTAWSALASSTSPRDLLTSPRLLAARAEINAEVERCTHTAPRFSYDATIAVFRINSPAQVHPLISTRWANHLSSPRLKFVLVANDGYRPPKVSFSCRTARAARTRGQDVDIIAELKERARQHESGTLLERMGESFARGHVQASGGVVGKDEFEELMQVMRVGEKPDASGKSPKSKGGKAMQKNTLTNYFGKS